MAEKNEFTPYTKKMTQDSFFGLLLKTREKYLRGESIKSELDELIERDKTRIS